MTGTACRGFGWTPTLPAEQRSRTLGLVQRKRGRTCLCPPSSPAFHGSAESRLHISLGAKPGFSTTRAQVQRKEEGGVRRSRRRHQGSRDRPQSPVAAPRLARHPYPSAPSAEHILCLRSYSTHSCHGDPSVTVCETVGGLDPRGLGRRQAALASAPSAMHGRATFLFCQPSHSAESPPRVGRGCRFRREAGPGPRGSPCAV